MDRNIQRNGLVNLLSLLVVGIASFFVAAFANTQSGLAIVAFQALGVLVAALSYVQMGLETREQLEKLELEDLRKRPSSSDLFTSETPDLYPAQHARRQFEKWIIPLSTITLLILQVVAAWWLWTRFSQPQVGGLREPAVAMSLFGLFFLIQFLLGQYSAGIARMEKQRLLRPGASYLLLSAYLNLAATISIAAYQFGFPRVDAIMAKGLCVLLTLIALETLIGLVLEVYRPRVKGQLARLLYESRFVGLLGQPENLITTAAQTIDYQFGFKVSQTSFYQFLQQRLGLLLLFQFVALWLSTSFVIVDPPERVLLEHFGERAAVLEPGGHLKWPWPVDQVHRYNTTEIKSFNIGFVPDPEKEKEKTVLWTVAHYKEEFNMLVASREHVGFTNAPTAAQAVPVNLLTVSIPVQYRISNITNWAYNYADAAKLLERAATREVVLYLVSVDLNEVMSTTRELAALELRSRIQKRADELNLGAEIVYVGLQDIHPPVSVASDYEAVVGATQDKESTILAAQGDAARTNLLARADAIKKVRESENLKLRRTTAAAAQAAQFANQLVAFNAAPNVFTNRTYLQTLSHAISAPRKYVIISTNVQEVFQLNLEDKIRADLMDINIPSPTK